MRRILSTLLLFLVAVLSATAEEIVLKDGTKIVGHMTGVTGDKIEVDSAYGKMVFKRADIVSINFPQNGAGSTPGAPRKKDVRTSRNHYGAPNTSTKPASSRSMSHRNGESTRNLPIPSR